MKLYDYGISILKTNSNKSVFSAKKESAGRKCEKGEKINEQISSSPSLID
jgi:hypothetical protein